MIYDVPTLLAILLFIQASSLISPSVRPYAIRIFVIFHGHANGEIMIGRPTYCRADLVAQVAGIVPRTIKAEAGTPVIAAIAVRIAPTYIAVIE